MKNIPLCRSFTYYVNPLSTSVTELGTKSHPYKELDSVFVELMNYHTHADRIITVNILEDSTVYILKPTYISNITEVIFKPYSVNTAIARKAKIVMVNSKTPIIPPAMPTKFSILGKSHQRVLHRYSKQGLSIFR